jgi:hypothetical protein
MVVVGRGLKSDQAVVRLTLAIRNAMLCGYHWEGSDHPHHPMQRIHRRIWFPVPKHQAKLTINLL